MALKLFGRKSQKAPKETKAAKSAKQSKAPKEEKKDPKIVEDKLPEDTVKVERVAEPPTSKQDTIEEEGDVSTVESAVDVPVQEESENSNPAYEKSDVPTEATKDLETSEEEADKEQSSFAGCCHGSPADVLKNLQAAVGMA